MTYLQRKKLAFMSIVNSVKGFVRTVTGIPPLTLPNCVDGNSVIGYTISGNSVQDGTPTPDAPIEVESVGEKTKNLFDKEYWNSLTSAKLENMRTLINVSDTAQVTVIPLGIGKGTYTFSVENALLTNGYYYGLYDVLDGNVVSRTMIYRNNEWLSPITINVTGELYIGSWYNSASLSAQPVRAIRDLSDSSAKTQIEEGTTATPYEPYGYKIPVKVSGKNLIPYIESITTNIYLNEPLRKINDYADYIDFENQKVVRGIKRTFPSDIPIGEWMVNVNEEDFISIYQLHANSGHAKSPKAFSNSFPFAIWENIKERYNCVWYAPSSAGFLISTSLIDGYDFSWTVAEKKRAVLDFFDKNGVDWVYPLAEPTEETIDLSKLPTFKGTTIYSIETNIQPSNISATYYSTSKGD